MPIVQSYSMYTAAAYEGMVFGLSAHMNIRTVEATKPVQFAQALKATDGTDHGVEQAGVSTAGKPCYGIGVRQINHEAGTRPSDGQMASLQGQLLGMMVEGEIMVKLSAAVARDAKVGMTAEGTWTSAAAFSNVVALKAGAVGDIIPVRIFSVTPA